ncbi:MAG: RNA pseudouridine synthase [Clostridia bacterium]|nr:RNA pseudouridine synthase [Clostridia bacterium]
MLKVLFENNNVIVCVKPAGVLSQSAADGKDEPDMLGLVSEHIGTQAGLLHRLDRPTGGIMAFSKSPKATGVLSAAISDKEKCIKEYFAVVSGEPDSPESELRDYLFKDLRQGKSFAVFSPRKGAKEACLTYKLLGTAEGEHGKLSLVKIRLGTGRTHQIRVQFSSRGMPVIGDGKYGSRERMIGEMSDFGVSPKDMIALHAYRLSLDAGKTAKFDVCAFPDKKLYPFSLFDNILTEEKQKIQ